MRTGVTVDRGLSDYLKTDLFNGIGHSSAFVDRRSSDG